jgi:uncharacterized membrane protein
MLDEIYTLQEFLTYTKSISYLLAAMLMISSIWLWKFLVRKESKIDKD